MAEPTTAIRIADTPIPPPSAARLHPVRPPLYRRQSRFTEEMAEDHTPVPSLYEYDDETSRSRIHQPRESPMPSPTTATPTLLAHSSSSSSLSHILRGMNGCAHGAACVILIAIMVEFLTQSRGHWYGKIRYDPFPPFPSPVANPSPPPSRSAQAIALLTFLSFDTTLDVISLIRLHTPWPTWALLLRVLCGVSYIALFFAYVARDHVFPPGFTFWAMPPGVAGPLVYGFLWVLGYVTPLVGCVLCCGVVWLTGLVSGPSRTPRSVGGGLGGGSGLITTAWAVTGRGRRRIYCCFRRHDVGGHRLGGIGQPAPRHDDTMMRRAGLKGSRRASAGCHRRVRRCR